MERHLRSLSLVMATALSASSACADSTGPGTSSLAVDLASVETFVRLAPRVWQLEREQLRALERSHRFRDARRAHRATTHVKDLERSLLEDTGVSIARFVLLRDAIVSIHRPLYLLRKLQEARGQLLARWAKERAEGTAHDEVYTQERERIEKKMRQLQGDLDAAPAASRSAVEARFDEVVKALTEPKVMSRQERREREERIGADYPPPPFDPYKT